LGTVAKQKEPRVTEAEWLACSSPGQMLAANRVWTARKLRLFACACVRLVWPLVRHERSRRVVEAAEQFADKLATWREMAAARAAAPGQDEEAAARWAARAAIACAIPACSDAAHSTLSAVLFATSSASLAGSLPPPFPVAEAREVSLIREMVGNPFRPVPVRAESPATVRQLAQSLYDGADCAFALHDALLEAGQTELAEHFAPVEKWHPKGCWAVDAILGKK
jgi:hypothetical protein